MLHLFFFCLMLCATLPFHQRTHTHTHKHTHTHTRTRAHHAQIVANTIGMYTVIILAVKFLFGGTKDGKEAAAEVVEGL